ncbi:type VI secretion system baseplate subunit TssE [Vibrio europaeus]|uniref:Lysozyme n=1 Tax=Vibrio europaeus TaxID=300876 RepID=A0A178JDB3_9VIBR|nr:type VI secretion system baseplate subunit TssE [Vibrio europaeus]MDC5703670.1 type VI secretion system baseplate subunit TssE [Vibrio europaeus]MDC5708376.1 type VI secretion system baseplate subunit TssE [Vibrio europaeus]MDC5714217.1 type VI secretion system baseplate subunit TssE [Vibrio europaeus]MDC5722432.1 type VI secretion system baseplate subunit TssE [Vibrio europaeus]MDC5727287.1 type VI secretion system baseplate subunit TssE [Vibrio europaeus]
MTYFAPEESTFGVGFFERLEANSNNVSLTQGPEPRDVLESIKLNVSKILNTRVGGSQSSPELGLIDFNDATLDTLDLSLKVKLAIQDCLSNFEPRLKNIEVSAHTDSFSPLSLQFKITAQINSEAIHDRVQISLLLDQNRKYRVI